MIFAIIAVVVLVSLPFYVAIHAARLRLEACLYSRPDGNRADRLRIERPGLHRAQESVPTPRRPLPLNEADEWLLRRLEPLLYAGDASAWAQARHYAAITRSLRVARPRVGQMGEASSDFDVTRSEPSAPAGSDDATAEYPDNFRE